MNLNSIASLPVRTAARSLTGSTYAVLGYDAWKTPGARVEMAASTLASVRRVVPLPFDDETLVRANGGIQAAAGALMTFGVLPRLSALVLAGSMVSTTIAGHPFWTVEDPAARKMQRTQFHKNMAMVGGLLFAALDNPKARARR
ncbi:DoxX family protein [Arthrobacter sp. KK5.5]|uniref:DoxX family protein n=1 Tax=Arthrobacter sp. KK5.5 TaxID=3373084 RepID=UPI003EE50646